jgi:hypothetical protein
MRSVPFAATALAVASRDRQYWKPVPASHPEAAHSVTEAPQDGH